MSWIKTIPYEEAKGKLKQLYDRVKGPDNNIDNILMSHSLRPHTLEGHMAIYKYVLHHYNNTLPKWFLETIGVYVSILNKCDYCIVHHFTGLRRLAGDEKAFKIRDAIDNNKFDSGVFDEAQISALNYAHDLTLTPYKIAEERISEMRNAGLDDGQILEVNQVTAYFCYANRTVLGLGCVAEGDILGLSPNNSENTDDWSHK